MKVIVAGSTGAIGRPLLRQLSAAGHDTIALIRNPAHHTLVTQLGAVPVLADVMDRDALLRALDGEPADAVIHQATALKSAGRKLRPDDPTNALRGAGTAHLLEVARVTGARRFVTQSLITGYGYYDHGETELTEDDPFGHRRGNAADAVVAGSVATEQQTFAAPGIEGIALRYGMLYGPMGFSDMFAGLLRKRSPAGVRGGGGYTGFIHVEDAASAALAALERGVAGQAYNCVDDEPITWGRFASLVAERYGTPRPLNIPQWMLRLAVPYLAILLGDTSMRVSHAKASRELAWRPRYPSVERGLREAG